LSPWQSAADDRESLQLSHPRIHDPSARIVGGAEHGKNARRGLKPTATIRPLDHAAPRVRTGISSALSLCRKESTACEIV
jgi:hypothetical protein